MFTLELWDDETPKTVFYTVRFDDADLSETDKFFAKYYNDLKYTDSATELMTFLIQVIGSDHGALEIFFNRDENEGVKGLPPHGFIRLSSIDIYFPQFPLRLYAMRVMEREDLVVLFGGGIKNAQTTQESKFLNMKRLEAINFCRRITMGIQEGMIEIDSNGPRLLSYDGTEEIFI